MPSISSSTPGPFLDFNSNPPIDASVSLPPASTSSQPVDVYGPRPAPGNIKPAPSQHVGFLM